MVDKVIKVFRGCKDTLKETLQLEDYDDVGHLPWSAIRDALDSLEIAGLDPELLAFLLFVLYSKSPAGLDELKYGVLFDLVEGKLNLAGGASESGLGA